MSWSSKIKEGWSAFVDGFMGAFEAFSDMSWKHWAFIILFAVILTGGFSCSFQLGIK